MSWIILVIAGLLEVVWAVGLKYTHGFSRFVTLRFFLGKLTRNSGLSGCALSAQNCASICKLFNRPAQICW